MVGAITMNTELFMVDFKIKQYLKKIKELEDKKKNIIRIQNEEVSS